MRDHVARGSYLEALHLFDLMLLSGTPPDNFTFPIALKACTALSSLQQGRQIHALLLTLGLLHHKNLHSANSLIAVYCKCGRIQDALHLFDEMPQRNNVTWNSIISGCLHNGLTSSSLRYFSQMVLLGLVPDSYTVCAVLDAHAYLGAAALQSGRAVHGYVVRRGLLTEEIMEKRMRLFVGNALVHMYLELNCLSYAEKVFEGMCSRDLITWTTMISGYVRCGLGSLAVAAFRLLVEKNVKLDPVVLVCVMPAIGFLWLGKEMHGFVVRRGLEGSNAFIGSSLLHMYAEFGSIEYAANLFERIHEKNAVLWTTMIMAYAKHGKSEDSLRLFEQMRREAGVTPNHLTFMGVLTACAHAGLVEQAKECFKCMIDEHQLKPDMHHYAAMVDVMGRAGQLREAMEFIRAMPVEPSPPVWGALLASCAVHQDLEMGREVAEIVMRMEPENPSNFVLLSNMFAGGQRWDEVGIVRETMRRRGLQKEFGSSLIYASTVE
ncbi:hypothetical protein MRB53_022172 [Persea americana]|uniref:Uncharacterized protein n=1 Tax=Persea americana TaxID=3435 RepID=A0ACC2L600_PERAE|nr:hypothetical protein MRB53_022172 [Persea americana]